MEFLSQFLPIIIYFLLIIVIVVGIVLGIKLIITMDKVKKDFIHVNNGTVLHHINVVDFNPQLDRSTRQYYTSLLNTVSYAFKLDF